MLWHTTGCIHNVCSEGYQLLLDKYTDVFREELGTLKSTMAQLRIKPQAMPKFCKLQAVPFTLKEALEKELAHH